MAKLTFHVVGLSFGFSAGHVNNTVKSHFVVEAESRFDAWEQVRNGDERISDLATIHRASLCDKLGCNGQPA